MRSIARGWTIASEDTARPNGVWTTKLTKAQHPEMTDVKPGTELMGVNFEEKPTSCDLEEYQALQARIERVKNHNLKMMMRMTMMMVMYPALLKK